MPQLSLYLPDAVMEHLKLRAQQEDRSLSAFVTSVLEEKLETSWPKIVTDLAGAYPDFPTRDELPPLADDPAHDPLVWRLF